MEPTDNKGEIAKIIRSKIGKTKVKDFAKLVGVHKNQLSRYMRGHSLPRSDIFQKIMEYKPEESAKIFRESRVEHEFGQIEKQKILNNLKEILEGEDEILVGILRGVADIHRSKKKNENKGGE